MVYQRVYVPKLNHSAHTMHTRGMKGTGLLLDSGKGGGNSYESMDAYVRTTNMTPAPSGSGLGKHINKKLEKLKLLELPKSKKPKNIQFNL